MIAPAEVVVDRAIPTGIGTFLARASAEGLIELRLPSAQLETKGSATTDRTTAATAVLDKFECELLEYLDGQRRSFETPIRRRAATPFLQAVYDACAAVPYGTTVTYLQLAERAGFPGRARAVGRAMATNPVPIVIPCHRVVGSAGGLTGYGGGIELKRWLLDLERGQARLL